MQTAWNERAIARDNREPLMNSRLVLVSPYDPAAGFNVGRAMQRNKLIYALADVALVVAADFQKGGTWEGAIEQLDRLHFLCRSLCATEPMAARAIKPSSKEADGRGRSLTMASN